MTRALVAFFVVLLLAGAAHAQAEWESSRDPRDMVRKGGWANYVPDEDTRSPTLRTILCDGMKIACKGTGGLSSIVQACDTHYEHGRALDISECDDVSPTALTCGGTHTIEFPAAPEYIRFKQATNWDGTQYFRVTCNGERR